MVGMKEKLGDDYDRWYKRHRLVENQRVWKKTMEENPMNLIPDYERTLPQTYSLEEAFYHRLGCTCGSCCGPLGRLAKILHVDHFPEEPWVRSAWSPIPTLPDPIWPHLRAAEEVVLSLPDRESG